MPGFRFFRRKSVYVPTLLSWLVLLVGSMAFAIACTRFTYPWLASHRPAPGARILVVDGWLAEPELNQAIALIRTSRYDKIVTTGGPIDSWTDLLGAHTHADLSAAYLRRHLDSRIAVLPLPAPASERDRSFVSAWQVRNWLAATGRNPSSIDVLSSGAHARRSAMIYRLALGHGIEVGILASRPATYPPDRWWTTSAGVKAVVGEALAVAWTACCFHPETGDGGGE